MFHGGVSLGQKMFESVTKDRRRQPLQTAEESHDFCVTGSRAIEDI